MAPGSGRRQAYIKASNTDAGDWFGRSIALSGDTLAVSAPHEDSAATGIDGDQSDNSMTTAGAVYVFTPRWGWGLVAASVRQSIKHRFRRSVRRVGRALRRHARGRRRS